MPEKAIAIAKDARSTFAQNNLNAQDMSQITEMAKIPKSVINYGEMDPRTDDAINPNSAIMSYFQLGEFSYENSSIIQVLMTLINGPLFDTLRNKEQLGYVVLSQFSSQNKVLGGEIIVQSSNHGPEFLEQRINNFLTELAKDPNGPFTEEQVDKIKVSQEQSLSQKAQDIATETQENWIYMEGDYIDPQSLSVQNVTGMLMNSFLTVTAKQVNQCFRDLFLNNQKRVNIKLTSQNHV